ncbi:cyclophilin-like fold protein, partial [Klebsiella pneumoniae]
MKKYKVVTAGLLLAGLIATGITWAAGQSNGEKNAQWRKPLNESITLRFGEKAYSVDLYDNPTTHDLLKKLPLNVQATDYPG